jgi:hypothetical protein
VKKKEYGCPRNTQEDAYVYCYSGNRQIKTTIISFTQQIDQNCCQESGEYSALISASSTATLESKLFI